jgi:hypothetical protein
MSRCVLDDEARRIEVTIGWDPQQQTFFARIWSRALYDPHRAEEVPEHTAGLLLWTGVGDRVWTVPDTPIEAIQPYACRHDKHQLRAALLTDQRLNSDRSYSLRDDKPPEPDLPVGWTPPIVSQQ